MNEKEENQAGEAAEELAKAARESYRAAVDQAFAIRESNARLARSFFEDWVDALEAQAELNRHTLKTLTELAREQREVFLRLSRGSLDAYDSSFDSLFDHYGGASKEPEEDS